MFQIDCFRCSQSSISTDGVRCFHCDDKETSRTAIAGNFNPLESEPGNVIPVYYVPASDASTQTTEDDFLLLEPNQDASTQTTDSDFSFLAKINGGHLYLDGSKHIGSSQARGSQVFDHNETENEIHNPENLNIIKDEFQIININRYNPSTSGSSLVSLNDSIEVSKKRTYHADQPSSDERHNIPNHDNMFKKQRMEYAQQANEVGRLNFEDSSSFPSEYSVPNSRPESSLNVNNSIVLARKQNKDSTSDSFPGNVVTTKSNLEHEVHNSGKGRRNVSNPKGPVKRSLRCGNCGESFLKDWIFQVHAANKCNPPSYKCDRCDKRFRKRWDWLAHQTVHTADRPFQCDQCAYAAKWKGCLKSHKERRHKKLATASGNLKIALMKDVFVL